MNASAASQLPVIQKMTAADLPRAAELEHELFPGQDPWSEQQLAQTLAAPHVRMLSLRRSAQDAQLLGYAALARLGPETDPEFEVYTIGVDPAFRGRGYGRALLAAMLEEVDAADAPVFLEVATGNIVARGLYEAHGFQVLGMRPNYYPGSGENAYTMRRPKRSEAQSSSPPEESASTNTEGDRP